ncbi:MAG: hypothetical protein AAF787_03965 [Chloroflexota bacterium]
MRSLIWCVLLLAACIPATAPPQLEYTPGPPVVVTDGRIQTAAFSVERPDGWRVITSAADAPLTLILVAPDDAALIVLATDGIGEPPRPTSIDPEDTLRDSTEQVRVGDVDVSVYAVGPSAQWDALQVATRRLVASLAAAG